MTREIKVLFDNTPYMKGWSKRVGSDLFTYVETGPAVCVIPARRNTRGQIEIVLINEVRPELNNVRIIKAAGGYTRGKDPQLVVIEKLREEIGIVRAKIMPFILEMEGFSTVRLPISTWIAIKKWDSTKLKDHCLVISLEQAVDMALDGRVRSQDAVDAILKMYILEERGKMAYIR